MTTSITSPPVYLSRATLRGDVPAAALRRLLLSDDPAPRTAAAHQLVWTLFSDSPDRRRDFLWREAEPGRFYLLSTRPPEDVHGLFVVDPPKPFAPALVSGDRLTFTLRVNATVARQNMGKPRARDGRVRGGRCDVVMNALRAVDGERTHARQAVLHGAAHDWLSRQGTIHGFALDALPAADASASDEDGMVTGDSGLAADSVRVMGYRVLRVDRGNRAGRLQLGILDLEGILTVRDPEVFIAAVSAGFGRAKAFGCGLMLIRRYRTK